jgi:hypothetical protein
MWSGFPRRLYASAQDWGQVLMIGGKSCSHGRAFTTIGLPSDLFHGYAPKLVERLRRRVAAESPSHIRQHPHPIRMTLLAALVFQRTQEVTDALVTLLIQIVHRIGKRAERRVAGKTRILYRIADAALEHPDDPVREVVFPVADEQTLRDLVAEYKAQGVPTGKKCRK